MATQDIHAPTLGAQGDPCASCGAPLAADQRYCLQCGARRAEARIAFREILGAQPPPGAAPPPSAGVPGAAAADEPPQRSGLAFLAGLVCLLLALGVGVLIGRSGNDTPTAAAPAPAQVITVGGSAPAATTATTPAAGATDTGASSSSSSGSGASSKSKNGSAAKSSQGSKATNKSVKSLNSASGQDYQKKSQKLPKQVGTGGKAPPKDNKPAGGGTGFQTIG